MYLNPPPNFLIKLLTRPVVKCDLCACLPFELHHAGANTLWPLSEHDGSMDSDKPTAEEL